MSVVVFGSINMDLVAQVSQLPTPAETLTGKRFFTAPGGKGANQAAAAGKQGVITYMVGRVGEDEFGSALIQNLASMGVQVEHISVMAGVSSGVALIAVADGGQNHIIVVPGANGEVDGNDLQHLAQILPGSRLLLLQLEIPLQANIAAATMAREIGIPVILDPAPARELPDSLLSCVDILTPNEVEASFLAGFPVRSREDAFRAADVLLAKGPKKVVVKLGAKGVVYAAHETGLRGYVPPFPVEAIDTVAAGDAFNGGLAAAILEGEEFPDAVRWGAATGALSTTKPGAQSSMPDRKSVLELMKQA